jgi:acetyl-CoA synthetase
VTWFEPFSELYEWELPYAKWYVGGKLNVTYNCVDRHVENGLGERVAYFWEGEPVDDRPRDHLRRPAVRGRAVRQRAQGARRRQGDGGRDLHGHGPGAAGGDARLARGLAPPHTVVFGGFSADSLAGRLNDMGCEVLVTQDEGLAPRASASP